MTDFGGLDIGWALNALGLVQWELANSKSDVLKKNLVKLGFVYGFMPMGLTSNVHKPYNQNLMVQAIRKILPGLCRSSRISKLSPRDG